MKETKFILLLLAFLVYGSFSFGQETDKVENDEEEEMVQDTVVPVDYTQLFNPREGRAIFVSETQGNDKFQGTKERPLQSLEKAIEIVNTADVIIVSEGYYLTGTTSITISKGTKIYGSFDESFTERDISVFPSVMNPKKGNSDNKVPFITFDNEVNETIIDGFVFDAAEHNTYSKSDGLYPNAISGALVPQKTDVNLNNSTPLLLFKGQKPGNIEIRNNLFLNAEEGGVKILHKGGRINIYNNVFVSNRLTAIDIQPLCAKTSNPLSEASCFDCFINFNTILFTWSKTPKAIENGCGLKIRGNINYFITNNIFGPATSCGIDNSKEHNIDLLRFDNNAFFCNKNGDMNLYSLEKKKSEFLSTHQFEDVEFRSVFSNIHEVAEALKMDNSYMEGFLNTVFVDIEDFTFDSHPNIWRKSVGIEKTVMLDEKLNVFANRYSLEKALLLFGNDPDRGAQFIK